MLASVLPASDSKPVFGLDPPERENDSSSQGERDYPMYMDEERKILVPFKRESSTYTRSWSSGQEEEMAPGSEMKLPANKKEGK